MNEVEKKELLDTMTDAVTVVSNKVDRLHKILETQNEIAETFHRRFEEHVLNVKPMLDTFHERKTRMEVYEKDGQMTLRIFKNVGVVAGTIAAVGVSIVYIKTFAINFFTK